MCGAYRGYPSRFLGRRRGDERSLWALDPCVFHLVLVEDAEHSGAEAEGSDACGLLEVHVDEFMLWTLRQFRDLLQSALGKLFPISKC